MLTQDEILSTLAEMESAKGVRVLFAAESGSRCWGFASPDSDYDVRFVYARPLEDYLRLGNHRDTIEWILDEEYDVSGWDIAKYLRLLRASNPTAFEWLGSPIVYKEAPDFALVRDLAPVCFNPVASVHHYYGMASKNWHDLPDGEIKLKKYLYVVRALLAIRWTMVKRTPVPMPFADLRKAMLEPEINLIIDDILEAKTSGNEKMSRGRVPELDNWIETTIATLKDEINDVEPIRKPAWEPVDEVFREIVAHEG